MRYNHRFFTSALGSHHFDISLQAWFKDYSEIRIKPCRCTPPELIRSCYQSAARPVGGNSLSGKGFLAFGTSPMPLSHVPSTAQLVIGRLSFITGH
jgi:hypothetical protein